MKGYVVEYRPTIGPSFIMVFENKAHKERYEESWISDDTAIVCVVPECDLSGSTSEFILAKSLDGLLKDGHII